MHLVYLSVLSKSHILFHLLISHSFGEPLKTTFFSVQETLVVSTTHLSTIRHFLFYTTCDRVFDLIFNL